MRMASQEEGEGMGYPGRLQKQVRALHSKRFNLLTGHRHILCIEDPFDINLDLGRYVNDYTVQDIVVEFARALQVLRTSGSFAEV